MRQIGVEPTTIRPADIDETPLPNEAARAYCARVAREKALAVPSEPDEVVLAADTTVSAGRRILGKPAHLEEARAFLTLLSGRRHQVISSVAVRQGDTLRSRTVLTRLRMKTLSDTEINAYLGSGDWQGKAGGYGIQGAAGAFIPWISGSYTSVVGLPLAETAALLQSFGVPIWGAGR